MIRILAFILFLPLAACTVGPDYEAPKSNFLDRWFAPETPQTTPDPVITAWWTVFDDPLLESYIGQAAQNNKDVEIALANLRRARALRHEESGALRPQVGAESRAERARANDETDNLFDAGFDASWELDIFGGNRRALEAAQAREESAMADYQGVILSAFSEVARNYFEARGLQKRIKMTEENTDLLRQTFDLIERRSEAGEASEFDRARAQGEYQLTSARLPNLRADLDATIFSLSVLLGQPPEALLDEMRKVEPLPAPPDVVPVGLRSDILRRRPDVREAERELAAAVADIGVETAELFPKFSLTGSAGSQARVFSDIFNAAGQAWSLGAFLQWSVFEGGAIRARIDAAEAGNAAALSLYEKTVLSALADAETALTRYGRELETRKGLEEGVQSRRHSVALARELFDAGEEDFLAVLDAERELIASEDSLVLSETQSITKLIALYTALGGGWEVYSAQKATAEASPKP